MSDVAAEIQARAHARVGQVLRGKWRLERVIGVGGMAAVYAGVHRNGMRGAVKILHAELSTHAGARERFVKEGYAANMVEHEGAVLALDDDVADDGSAFIVMELLDGASVEQLAVKHGLRLSLAEVAAIGDQLLDVLAAAHDKEIWHRDLKPENLFVTRRGRVKVLDFGIAKVKQSASTSRGTSTGSVMGTPAFMPPEQALGKWSQVDGRTDLWAVGATLLNLLTGALVHQGETAMEVLVAAAGKPAPPVKSFDASIPDAVAAVIDRALAFDKEKRWPEARAMQQAWRAAAGEGDLSRLMADLGDSRASLVSDPGQKVSTVATDPEALATRASDDAPALPAHPPASVAQAVSAITSSGDGATLSSSGASAAATPILSPFEQRVPAFAPAPEAMLTTSPVSNSLPELRTSRATVAIGVVAAAIVVAGIGGWAVLRTSVERPAPGATPDDTSASPSDATLAPTAGDESDETDEAPDAPSASTSATPASSGSAQAAASSDPRRVAPKTRTPGPPAPRPSATAKPAGSGSTKYQTEW